MKKEKYIGRVIVLHHIMVSPQNGDTLDAPPPPPLATPLHLQKRLNYAYALFLCQVSKALILTKIDLKLSYFCKKKLQNLLAQTPLPSAAGSSTRRLPMASGGWRLWLQTPKYIPIVDFL